MMTDIGRLLRVRQHPDLLYRSMVEGAGDLLVAFEASGTIVFANQASRTMLGRDPEDIEGCNVLDFIHPGDRERAIRALGMNAQFGAAPGLTAFRLLAENGVSVMVDMTGGHATDDGERLLFTSTSRVNENREALHSTLVSLLDGASLEVALRSVCDIFTWRANGSQIGVSWLDDSSTPWADVRRSGVPIMSTDLDRLDPGRRDEARRQGLASFWIEPIAGAVSEPALVTVWTAVGRRPPLGHELGMQTAHSVVAVILRWAEQQRLLDLAAFHDPLTGLPNRKSFFDAIGGCEEGGVVLYCDLDRFKPVNDRHGHAAGDLVLKIVSARLQTCVRHDDVVARIGGDEFAILCPGLTLADAQRTVERIHDSIVRPVDLAGTVVEVGISVGIGHDPDRITERLIDLADRELYAMKHSRPHAGEASDEAATSTLPVEAVDT